MRRERRVRGLQNGWGGAVGFALLGCSDPPPPEPDASPAAARDFGVLLVDVGYDDPTDPAPVTSYLDEVRAFSTFGDIFDPDPAADLRPDATGAGLALRADHASRWQAFVAANQPALTPATVVAFYLGEEPTQNGISPAELATGGPRRSDVSGDLDPGRRGLGAANGRLDR